MLHSLVLHSSTGACSLAVHIAPEESDVPSEARRVVTAEGAHRTPALLTINSRRRVPAMSVDGRVATDVQALLRLFTDLAGVPLVTDDLAERARMRELPAFQSGTVKG